MALEHAQEIRREVDRAAFGRLRRLDAIRVDGALDLERSGADVDVAGFRAKASPGRRPALARIWEATKKRRSCCAASRKRVRCSHVMGLIFCVRSAAVTVPARRFFRPLASSRRPCVSGTEHLSRRRR
jgi:hypothetical protein